MKLEKDKKTQMIKIIKGDLLEAKEQYITQQTNCCSQSASGLAYYLFHKFPYANTYRNRFEEDVPGTIIICGNGLDKRYVINMNAQYTTGGPKYISIDTSEIREVYFQQCLDQISKIENLESIAFPYLIGCGLAKGNWNNYFNMLNDFAETKSNIEVVIYQKD